MSWWAQQGQKAWKTRRHKCDGWWKSPFLGHVWKPPQESTRLRHTPVRGFTLTTKNIWKSQKVLGQNVKDKWERDTWKRRVWWKEEILQNSLDGAFWYRQWLKSRTISTQRGFFQGKWNVSLPRIQISLHFVYWRQIWRDNAPGISWNWAQLQ